MSRTFLDSKGTVNYQSCTLLSCRNLTLWSNIETTSKLWDLNYKAESLEKAGFLYYLDAPKLTLARKREREMQKAKYLKGKGRYTKIGPTYSSTLRLHYTSIFFNQYNFHHIILSKHVRLKNLKLLQGKKNSQCSKPSRKTQHAVNQNQLDQQRVKHLHNY